MLGQIAVLRGDNRRAHLLLEQGLALSRDVDEGKNIPIKTQIYLGMALLREADLPAALAQLREALAIACTIMDGPQIVLALQELACVAVVCGDAMRAARLFGAGEALSRAQGQALLPAECALTIPFVRAARGALGAGTFAAAWAEGKGLTVEQAYTLATEIERHAGVEPLRDQLAQPAATVVGRLANNLPPQPAGERWPIGDRGGLATALHGLGLSVCMWGDYESAGTARFEMLQVAAESPIATLKAH